MHRHFCYLAYHKTEQYEMIKNTTSFKLLFLLLAALAVGLFYISPLNPIHKPKGLFMVEVYDDLTNKPIANASVIVMDKEKVFKTDANGKTSILIETKPNSEKEFMGYTIMVIEDGYMPAIFYNVTVYPGNDPEMARTYTVKLKKPEPFNNAWYDTQFLPTSSDAMVGIIEYYKRLIK